MDIEHIKWTTFDGRQVSTETISLDHLSNAYWYSKVIIKNNILAKRLYAICILRFGRVMEYCPHPCFKSEIDYLKNNKVDQFEEEAHILNQDIIYKNEVIGKLSKKEC